MVPWGPFFFRGSNLWTGWNHLSFVGFYIPAPWGACWSAVMLVMLQVGNVWKQTSSHPAGNRKLVIHHDWQCEVPQKNRCFKWNMIYQSVEDYPGWRMSWSVMIFNAHKSNLAYIMSNIFLSINFVPKWDIPQTYNFTRININSPISLGYPNLRQTL